MRTQRQMLEWFVCGALVLSILCVWMLAVKVIVMKDNIEEIVSRTSIAQHGAEQAQRNAELSEYKARNTADSLDRAREDIETMRSIFRTLPAEMVKMLKEVPSEKIFIGDFVVSGDDIGKSTHFCFACDAGINVEKIDKPISLIDIEIIGTFNYGMSFSEAPLNMQGGGVEKTTVKKLSEGWGEKADSLEENDSQDLK